MSSSGTCEAHYLIGIYTDVEQGSVYQADGGKLCSSAAGQPNLRDGTWPQFLSANGSVTILPIFVITRTADRLGLLNKEDPSPNKHQSVKNTLISICFACPSARNSPYVLELVPNKLLYLFGPRFCIEKCLIKCYDHTS